MWQRSKTVTRRPTRPFSTGRVRSFQRPQTVSLSLSVSLSVSLSQSTGHTRAHARTQTPTRTAHSDPMTCSHGRTATGRFGFCCRAETAERRIHSRHRAGPRPEALRRLARRLACFAPEHLKPGAPHLLSFHSFPYTPKKSSLSLSLTLSLCVRAPLSLSPSCSRLSGDLGEC